jgi:hypothetical protein
MTIICDLPPGAAVPGISLHGFKATLEEFLERTIQILPMRLEPGFAGCCTGRSSTDRIGYDPRLPALTLEVVTHAAGHLALGHSEAARSNGRFACSLSSSSVGNRVFSDTEELMAAYFASVVLRLFDVTPIQSSRRSLFTCTAPATPRRSS